MQESNSDNNNGDDDNHSTCSSHSSRGDNNKCSKKKNEDALMKSSDNGTYDNDEIDDGDNNNGMDDDDNGQLLLSRIMNLEETNVRPRAKKKTNVENDDSCRDDDYDDNDEFKLDDEHLNDDRNSPAARARNMDPNHDATSSSAKSNSTQDTENKSRRCVRKGKEIRASMQESDSDDWGSGADGEFKASVSAKSNDDKSLSDDAATKKKRHTPKKKSSSTQHNKEQKQEGTTADSKDEEDDDADRPIPTQNGGYSHTQKTKKKIGLANKGNTPWNKGKKRSEEEKAKITASVLARNHKVLLVKLEKLGMTENEWCAHKKKLKLTRENNRRKLVKEREREAALNARTPEEIEAEKLKKEEIRQKRKKETQYERERLKRVK